MRSLRSKLFGLLFALSSSFVVIAPTQAAPTRIDAIDDQGVPAPVGYLSITKTDVQSQADGWTVTKQPNGPHSVTVAHPAYDVEVVSVEVTQGEISRIIVKKRPKQMLRVRVVNESGADIVGAHVSVAVDGVRLQRMARATWEHNGKPAQQSGLHTIIVSGTSYGDVTTVAAPGRSAEIVLPGAVACPTAAPCKPTGGMALRPSPSFKERPVWPLAVGSGVAGLGLVFGAVFTGLAIENTHRAADIRDALGSLSACYAPPVPANCGELSDAVDNQDRFTNLAAVAFSVGTGAAVAGLLLHFVLPKQVKKISGDARVHPWVGTQSGGVGFTGTF